MERFWDIIEEININKVLRFLRDNIVSKWIYFGKLYRPIYVYENINYFTVTVVVITSLFWIPISCLISFFDRKKRRQETKDFQWSNTLDLIHSSDRRRVIHIR